MILLIKKYIRVSILRALSKIYEKLMQRQINNYITNHLSPHLCEYRKDYNTHQHLVSGIERWQNILDDKGFRGAVLMHLSKAFNALNHELPIAKLQAYGFNRDLLKLINTHLSNRWQMTALVVGP